ncbi:MAG: hypothetical protein AMXMBFR84_24040 [Candidatus Hydrogenedentota bacterium]
MAKRQPILETDLHKPLAAYLEKQGYTVRSEVNSCDMVAVKGDDLIVIELKRSLTATLLAQAARRQKMTDAVYVALPRPSIGLNSRLWRDYRHLLRRLELGLILVNPRGRANKVEIVFHPIPFARRKQPRDRRALLKEIQGRSADYNTAGSTRKKLVTAYREEAIYIACCLKVLGVASPAQLRKMGCSARTTRIAYDNVYGWFDRVERGVYRLRVQGEKELNQFQELACKFAEEIARRQIAQP